MAAEEPPVGEASTGEREEAHTILRVRQTIPLSDCLQYGMKHTTVGNQFYQRVACGSLPEIKREAVLADIHVSGRDKLSQKWSSGIEPL